MAEPLVYQTGRLFFCLSGELTGKTNSLPSMYHYEEPGRGLSSQCRCLLYARRSSNLCQNRQVLHYQPVRGLTAFFL